MYFRTVVFVALFSSLSQQSSGLDHINSLQQRNALIQARQLQDLSYCFSPTSICSESNNLFGDCNAFEGQADVAQWFQCICGNGYVTADTECDWCQEAYGLSYINNEEENTSACSQYNSGTIAPLPSSVLAAVSAFNATYTGVISGPANTATGGSTATATGSAAVASTTKSPAPEQTSSSTPQNTRSGSSPSDSASQGATVTQTLNGGSFGTLTAAPTSNEGGVETSSPTTSSKAGSGTGDAQGRNTGVAVMFSVFACGISVLCLL